MVCLPFPAPGTPSPLITRILDHPAALVPEFTEYRGQSSLFLTARMRITAVSEPLSLLSKHSSIGTTAFGWTR